MVTIDDLLSYVASLLMKEIVNLIVVGHIGIYSINQSYNFFEEWSFFGSLIPTLVKYFIPIIIVQDEPICIL